MTRTLPVFALLFGLVSLAAAQDPGRPPLPTPTPAPALGNLFVFNNTPTDVVYVLSSGRGTIRGILRPNTSDKTLFYNDGRIRILTAFKFGTGELLTNRAITCIDGNYYDILPPTVSPTPMPVPTPMPLPGKEPNTTTDKKPW